MTFLFDGYSLNPGRRELRHGREDVAVEPQVFDLLLYLVQNRDRVVSKDELMAQVWSGRIVSESTVSSRITAVRHAIGDDGEKQRLVRTLPRKGFRFVGTVSAEDVGGDAAPASETAAGATPRLAAERRQLTIVACSIVDAAGLARSDPEELTETLALYRQCLAETIARHGGHITRHTDDGIVACFGYPVAHEDDAERAVRAALAATHAVAGLSSPGLAHALHARAGIATGLMLVGAGADAAADGEPSIAGETVFVAARMEALAPAGAVIAAAGTRRLVGELFDYDPGWSQSDAVRVLRESTVASRFEALRPNRKPLIGREEELTLLRGRWEQAKSGEGRVILVWGEPGIGKSHLVAAFQDEIGREQHAAVRYFCSPSRTQTALYPVIAELERGAGFDAGDADATRLDKLERLLATRSPDASVDIPLVADLLSLATGDRYPAAALSAQRRKELLLEALGSQFAAWAARHPLLVLLEDAHWIDPTTRELFDVMVERVGTLPVLLVITHRPEFKPPGLGLSHVTALTLSRLGRRSNEALVKQTAGGKDIPVALLDEIVARTDGVPLFVEELTKSIIESGILRELGDAYVLDTPSTHVAVPSSLHASLVARLDRVGAARAVVQMGAALGREFRYAVVKAVAQLPDADLAPFLDALVASELVHQRGEPPWSVYVFKHALVQDAAYETIAKRDRPALHRRIVDVIEAQFPDVVERHPELLAHHCARAALTEKAIDYAIRAARIALTRSAGIEAQTQVESAMRLVGTLAPGRARDQIEGRLHHALGDAFVMTQGFASPRVMSEMSKARSLLDEKAHPLEALGALSGLFNYHLIRSESPRCLALIAPLLHRKSRDRSSGTVVHYLAGTAHLHLGNFARSIENLEASLRLYDEDACRPVAFVGGYHLRSFTLIWLGLAYLYVGDVARAARTVAAAVSDARSRLHPFTLVSALLALARFRLHTRDLPGAIAATEEGMAIAAEQRSPYHVSRAAVLRAVNVVEEGRPREGIALMEDALAAHRATGANFQSSFVLSCLARAHSLAGHHARADALALEALSDVDGTGERWWEAEAWRVRAEILLSASDGAREEAKACLTRALECARRQHARFWELQAALSLAQLLVAEGKRVQAERLLRPICRTFDDGYPIEALAAARRLLETTRNRTTKRRSNSTPRT